MIVRWRNCRLDIALQGAERRSFSLLVAGGLLARDHGGAAWAGAARCAAGPWRGGVRRLLRRRASRPDGSPLAGWRSLAVSTGNNVIFWLFARALFDDDFKPRPPALRAVGRGDHLGASLMCGLVLRPFAFRPGLARLDANGSGGPSRLRLPCSRSLQTFSSWRADPGRWRRRRRLRVAGWSASTAGYIGLNAAGRSGCRAAPGPGAAELGQPGRRGRLWPDHRGWRGLVVPRRRRRTPRRCSSARLAASKPSAGPTPGTRSRGPAACWRPSSAPCSVDRALSPGRSDASA